MLPASESRVGAAPTHRLVFLLLAIAAALALALALEFAGPSAVHAQSIGPVSGVVVNGTERGPESPDSRESPGLAGLSVFFLATDESGALAYSARTETGPDGAFSFPGVPIGAGGRYLFNVTYAGVDYSRVAAPDEASDGVIITVYETTNDVSVIQVSRQVLVITGVDPKERRIAALEFVRFANTGDRTLQPDLTAAAPMMSFIRFSLPPQAAGLNVNSDLPSGEVISVGTGFAVTSPITPGDHNVEFSFTFPYDGDGFSYRQNLLQGVGVYQLMVPEALSGIDVSPLNPVAPVDIQGSRYRVWEIGESAPGEGFTLELTNLPQPSLANRLASSLGRPSLWQVVIPVTLGAGLAAALVLGIANRPRLAAAQPGNGGGGEPPPLESRGDARPETREDLVLQLALLDHRFELGQEPPEDYNSTRQALKERVMALSYPGDAGTGDAGAGDAGVIVAGAVDAGVSDTGASDAGASEPSSGAGSTTNLQEPDC